MLDFVTVQVGGDSQNCSLTNWVTVFHPRSTFAVPHCLQEDWERLLRPSAGWPRQDSSRHELGYGLKGPRPDKTTWD